MILITVTLNKDKKGDLELKNILVCVRPVAMMNSLPVA